MEVEKQDVSNAEGEIVSDNSQMKDQVSYETHSKLLGQRKRDLEKMKELESLVQGFQGQKKQDEESKLVEQGEYKKLLEARELEITNLRQENTEHAKHMTEAHKLNAFREKLPGTIKNSAYYNFVNMEAILIDPETGIVDEASVSEEVNTFMKDHYSLVKSESKTALPNNATKDIAPKTINDLSREEQIKLVLANHR